MNRKGIRSKKCKKIIMGKRTIKRLRCNIVMASLTYRVQDSDRGGEVYPSIDIYLN